MQETNLEKVELYLYCRNLRKRHIFAKVDPQIRVFIGEKDNKTFLGQTELIKNCSNPNFSTPILTDFVFETNQILIFEVLDFISSVSFDLIGTVQTTVGAILGAQKQLLVLPLKDKAGKENGKIIIQGEKTGKSKTKINWQWSGIKLMNTDGLFDKSDPFLRFMKIRGPKDFLLVHETEVIMNNLNPVWKPFSIMDYKICGSDHNKPFRIECWDWESDKRYQYIGDCEVTLDQIKSGKDEFELHNPKKSGSTGKLKLKNFSLEEVYSFIDYIRGGQQLKLMVGIDFTNSRKFKSESIGLSSLRSIHDEYHKALQTVCQILLNYDYDHNIPVYGFGGIPLWPQLNNGNVSHFFPCTGNPQYPAVNGLEGILGAYSYAFQNVEFSGPAHFSPMIQEVMKFCERHRNLSNGVYTVFLILTDGQINDLEDTINCLICSSHLPLSIIIVGIGDGDFKNMERLDGDRGLYNSKGMKAQRDLVQFVPFKKFKEDMLQLARYVLAEVPDQLVEYMRLINKKPNPPIQTNLNDFDYTQEIPQPQQLFNLQNQENLFYQAQPSQAFNLCPNLPQQNQHMPFNNSNSFAQTWTISQNFSSKNCDSTPQKVQENAQTSGILHRYSIEPVIQPLQEVVNLNTFGQQNPS